MCVVHQDQQTNAHQPPQMTNFVTSSCGEGAPCFRSSPADCKTHPMGHSPGSTWVEALGCVRYHTGITLNIWNVTHQQ